MAHKETALDPKTAVLHPELGDNLAFRKVIDTGDVDAAFAAADIVVDGTFSFGRHTAVSLNRALFWPTTTSIRGGSRSIPAARSRT